MAAKRVPNLVPTPVRTVDGAMDEFVHGLDGSAGVWLPEHYDRRWDLFLEWYSQYGNQTKARKLAGIPKTTLWNKLHEDPPDETFMRAYTMARAIGLQGLEDEAARRAYEGVLEPVFYKGEIVGYVRKPSDGLLNTLLKANFPDKYAERNKSELTGELTFRPMVLPAEKSIEEWQAEHSQTQPALDGTPGLEDKSNS